LDTEFSNFKENISFKIVDWLPNWWKLILRGGWHAPIVTVNGKVIFQGQVIDRGYLSYCIRRELVKFNTIPEKGIIIYTKENCKYCKLVKELLKVNNLNYTERDVVKDPSAAAEIFFHTKKFFPSKKPVTTPQIWIDGKYVGGADELLKILEIKN
jgi:glutaredoxin